MSTVDAVLARLAAIRSTGTSRWLAKCPAHGDHSPSLSIMETRAGVTVLHCFAGCETSDVLAAIGLNWRDLYPPRGPGAAETRARPWSAFYSARELLEIVSEEVTVVAIVAADFLAQRSISTKDWQRLATAVGRIQRVRDRA